MTAADQTAPTRVDRRKLRTRRAMVDAAVRLMASGRGDRATVQEITEEADIGSARSTTTSGQGAALRDRGHRGPRALGTDDRRGDGGHRGPAGVRDLAAHLGPARLDPPRPRPVPVPGRPEVLRRPTARPRRCATSRPARRPAASRRCRPRSPWPGRRRPDRAAHAADGRATDLTEDAADDLGAMLRLLGSPTPGVRGGRPAAAVLPGPRRPGITGGGGRVISRLTWRSVGSPPP